MKHIKHIFWDLDGVFFRHDRAYQQALHESLARHIAERHKTDYSQALTLADHSLAVYKSCFQVFMDKYGYGFEELAAPTYDAMEIGFMQPDPEFLALLNQTGTTHTIITKSSLAWARRILTQVGASAMFPDNSITACADHITQDPDFDKARSTKPYLYTLERHGFDPAKTLMIDDGPLNLKQAKAAGLRETVLVHFNQNKPDYVDHQSDTPVTFLHSFIAQRNAA